MTRTRASLNLIAFAACHVLGQSTRAPAFDVVSIKPSDPAATRSRIDIPPGGRYTATNATVGILIQQAYGVRDFQISGGPGWINAEKYDVDAKTNGAAEDDFSKMTEDQRKVFVEQLHLKLQALLTDRFHLKVHRETKELPVYALIVAKNGPRLEAAKDDGGPLGGVGMGPGAAGQMEMNGNKTPLTVLALSLSNLLGRTVLDKTGIKGTFNFKIVFAPDFVQPPPGPGDGGVDRTRPADANGPSIFTALQEQLGLKLDAQKGPVEVVVIDSVEKASEN